MVTKTNKIPLKDILAAIDMNAKNVWDELSDDERKQVSFYLLNRFVIDVGWFREILHQNGIQQIDHIMWIFGMLAEGPQSAP